LATDRILIDPSEPRRVMLASANGSRLLLEFRPFIAATGVRFWEVEREIELRADGSVSWKFPTPDNDQWPQLTPSNYVEDPQTFGPEVSGAEFERLWRLPVYQKPGPLTRLVRWVKRRSGTTASGGPT
jgi:hypothetical protein